MRVALHTRLKAGEEAGYLAAHREVPAELTAAIRAAGVHEWTIWCSGLEVFHLIECDDYPRLLAELRDLPVNIAWQARMDTHLDVPHDYRQAGERAGLPVVWRLP